MGHPPQTGLNAADDHRHVFVTPADQIPVNNSRPIRPLSCQTARRIGVCGPAFPGNKIMVYHGVHISAGDKKGKSGTSE